MHILGLMAGTTDLSREFPVVIVELDVKVRLLLICWASEEELLGNEIGNCEFLFFTVGCVLAVV